MTKEQLKIRTQQTIDAIPVLREKEYGWAEIEKMLNEILIELDDSPWHTGTPTDEGWYLIKYKHNGGIRYIAMENPSKWVFINDDTLEWQKIEP